MSVATLANSVVKHFRWSQAVDTIGSPKRSLTSLGTLNARVQPVSGDAKIEVGRERERITHNVYIPGSEDVKSGDRFVVQSNGLVLEVLNVRDIDLLGRFVTCGCEQVEYEQ